jgi:hypothetical protein
MTPIRHKNCGAIVFWYTGDRYTSRMRSADVLGLDGKRPEYGGVMGHCPSCGGALHHGKMLGLVFIPTNIYRSFDEDLEPGFDVATAMKKQQEVAHKPNNLA